MRERDISWHDAAYPGRIKLLSAAGSAAVLINGIKESWRLARKILSQFKLLWFLNVFYRASGRPSVRPSVRLSVRHTLTLCENDAS